MTTVTPTLEFYNGSSWVDISTDAIVGSLKWNGGIRGGGPTDRVAIAGQLNVKLRNGLNSSGGVGYYSPDHANKRTGWAIGAKIRIKLVSGANTRYWMYRVKDITPVAGKYGQRIVDVMAKDYMQEFSDRKVSGLSIQADKRSDELITTLVAAMPFAPVATSYATGVFNFSYAFQDERDEDTACLTVLQKIAQSDLSYIFVDGDATGGETLKYETHLTRFSRVTSSGTLNDTMSSFDLVHSQDNVNNKIKATTYPIFVDTAITVLGSVPEEFPIEPGETKTIYIRYVDENTGKRVSGLNIVTPEVDTDYKMSSLPNDGGNDLNANITVTATAGANTLSAEIENTGSVKGYVNKLQVRGNKVTTYDKIESVKSDSTSITTYGEKTLTFNMPYQNNSVFGESAATEILRRYKNPVSNVSGISFIANKSDTLMGYALTHGIGTRETIVETMTGVNGDFYINGYEYALKSGNILDVTWILERSWNSTQFFTIDNATYGAINGAYLIAPF